MSESERPTGQNDGSPTGVVGFFTGYYPWTPAHPCYNGHKLVDSDTPMVCERCGAWLVYNPNGSWRSVDTATGRSELVADGGQETDGTDHVPAPAESDLMGTLERVRREGEAECRLCGETVEGDSYGEVFEALAEHGEEAHDWDDSEGWSA